MTISADNTYTIEGVGQFALPENRLLRVFESQHNVAIIDPSKQGQNGNPFGVVDSVHTRTFRTPEERVEGFTKLITRNGGQLVSALS